MNQEQIRQSAAQCLNLVKTLHKETELDGWKYKGIRQHDATTTVWKKKIETHQTIPCHKV
jgi:hypothetical protein